MPSLDQGIHAGCCLSDGYLYLFAFTGVVIKCSVDSDYLSFLDCGKDGTRDFQVWVSRLLGLGRHNVSSSGNINVRNINGLHYSTLHAALRNQTTV
jgi:hypothetical protein